MLKLKLTFQGAQEKEKMALRDGNEADAVVAGQKIPLPAPRPKKTIVNIQPFTGKDSDDITE